MNYSFILDDSFEKEVKRLSKRSIHLSPTYNLYWPNFAQIRNSEQTSVVAYAKSVCASRRKAKARAAAQGSSHSQ